MSYILGNENSAFAYSIPPVRQPGFEPGVPGLKVRCFSSELLAQVLVIIINNSNIILFTIRQPTFVAYILFFLGIITSCCYSTKTKCGASSRINFFINIYFHKYHLFLIDNIL